MIMTTATKTTTTIPGKVVLLGDQGVGKTSLVLRYIEKEYNRFISPTIGASYFSCAITVHGLLVKLQIWDTAGQERFRAMAPMFYRNANAAVLVYDITRPETFEHLKDWVLELNGNVEKSLIMCIVGGKLDLASQRCVPKDEAIKYSTSIGANYYECSALKDQGIEKIFDNIAYDIAKSSGITFTTRTLNNNEDNDDEENAVGNSSDLSATDVGTVIVLGGSIDNIAHGDVVQNKCCY